MAESIIKDFKGKSDWVYVGKAKAIEQTPEARRADTLYNEYVQKVFDVAAPVAISEIDETSAVQGLIVKETAEMVGMEKPADKKTFAKKWMELEKKYSSPEHENRLGKLVFNGVYMVGSFGINLLSNVAATKLFLDPKKLSIPLPFDRSISLSEASGNKEMLKAGWEYLTDIGTEKVTDWSVKQLTNREDIGFVSPLSRALGKLGNTAITVFGDLSKRDMSTMLMNSLVNPGVIEGAFRFAGALPGGGALKELYGWANKQVMKGEGILPVGTDLAYNMLIAKMIYKQKPISDTVHHWERE